MLKSALILSTQSNKPILRLRFSLISRGMSSPRETYNKLAGVLKEIHALRGVNALLEWDQQVMMPAAASDARGAQMEALAGILHEKQTSDELSRLIYLLSPKGTADLPAELNEWEQAVVRDAKRNFERKSKIPKELEQRAARLSAEGYTTWVAARKESDFAKFAPVLKQWIEIRREQARCIDATLPVYDVLLDEYERGLTADRIDTIFAEVKRELQPLIKRIGERPAPDASFLAGLKFDTAQQAALNHQIAKDLGFDTERGRLDVSVHPFTCELASTDVRMTTRYKDTDIVEGITGTVHETGHSLYEQGKNADYDGLPVAEALSMGIHESQSLLWERMVALSLPFWQHYWPKVLKTFPDIKSDTPAEAFYYLINKVEPGMIRVEADEVTYPMHIILRYELERGLMDGSIVVDDLPQLWNAKMREYLGIVPRNDGEGVLQDTHWSGGAFGYFPTYTLGAIAASQFFAHARTQLPHLDHDIAAGQFSSLKEWLNSNVHRVGSLLPSADQLMTRVTGRPVDPSAFLAFLKTKYSTLYKL
eukprot:TRINITY_DN9948_c0_g1_i1.p1 TRINITY_DN9948_c0_g1~~TRINITY_DN9948_c0_g1_i1.p1  ORF type:complete len:536 (-),score=202.83 TRINITY_DN9948_c0_g1_i1:6-1613(-)